MSDCAMNNETGLDWLARNVHVWPYELQTHCYVMTGSGGKKETSASAYSPFFSKFTKDQWLSRRAELQNKPSWNDAPEWARRLSQDYDGAWWWYQDVPEKCEDGWWSELKCKPAAASGEVLGDWRYTLEKRPEQDEFKPFTSIEDNQELSMSNKQDVKQDSGWYDRGELPPVGVECEAYVDGCWQECYVVGFSRIGDPVIEVNRFITDVNRCKFRPIRTERQLAIEEMKQHLPYPGSWDMVGRVYAAALYDAGYRKESK